MAETLESTVSHNRLTGHEPSGDPQRVIYRRVNPVIVRPAKETFVRELLYDVGARQNTGDAVQSLSPLWG